MFISKSLLASTFVALISVASATPTKPDAEATVTTPDLGTAFSVYPGWDMDNGNSQKIINITELACMQLCSTSTSCVAYSYVPYGGAPDCYLKSSINLSTFKVQTVDVNAGLSGACGTFAPVGPTKCFTVTVPA
ncbi:hypothetical protein B0H13DRAFT_2328872 [Mycena leptocephala]|nr:hypothetical protein B0H13DRAFT_1914290 [Mycena leptocephala]KAJ7910965.1 hypothetical protein B0H13DRAFT_2328872 [Mycena leptocephala]